MSTLYRGAGWARAANGEYKNGTVYRGVGWARTAIGEYDGAPYDEGAAAAAFLLLSFD